MNHLCLDAHQHFSPNLFTLFYVSVVCQGAAQTGQGVGQGGSKTGKVPEKGGERDLQATEMQRWASTPSDCRAPGPRARRPYNPSTITLLRAAIHPVSSMPFTTLLLENSNTDPLLLSCILKQPRAVPVPLKPFQLATKTFAAVMPKEAGPTLTKTVVGKVRPGQLPGS